MLVGARRNFASPSLLVLLDYQTTGFVKCVSIPFILDVRFVYVPAAFTQEEGHTGFLHLPFAAPACLNFSREEDSVQYTQRRYFQYAHFIPLVGVGKRGEY